LIVGTLNLRFATEENCGCLRLEKVKSFIWVQYGVNVHVIQHIIALLHVGYRKVPQMEIL
jgi:hypothetical protein